MTENQKRAKRKKYSCCGGSPDCAINKTNRRIDRLWWLAILNPKKFKDDLWEYMESVETDRDFWKAKAKGDIP